MRSKAEIREDILKLIQEYTQIEATAKKPFFPGQKIPYCSRVYDYKERENLTDAMLDFWLTAGRFHEAFEKKLGEYLGVEYVAAVNSGSSANLIAFMALTSPLLKERRICRGDEVICVAAAFPTTVAPIIQYGAIPVFVDVELETCNIDVTQLEDALSEKTKCIFVAHTLGNPMDLKELKAFCDKYNLWLIEDNCDALGAEFDMGYGPQKTGTIGDIGTSSFYPAHHITMGEGGAVYTNNELLGKIILSMRDWGRDCVCPPGKDNTCRHRFDGRFGELPSGYDHKYVYSHFGYNCKITDLQASIGCAQIEKLPEFVDRRYSNWRTLKEGLLGIEDKVVLPNHLTNAKPSPFGFLLTIKESVKKDRNEVVAAIESKGIQTRMLFGGNILKQPCFVDYRKNGGEYRVLGNLENTDLIMNRSFWVGVYPGLTETMIQYMIDVIKGAVNDR